MLRLVKSESDATIFIEGRFTFNDHAAFRRLLATVNCPLLIDLTDATYIDSSALGMILVARDRVTHGIKLKAVPGPVLTSLNIAAFSKLFEII